MRRLIARHFEVCPSLSFTIYGVLLSAIFCILATKILHIVWYLPNASSSYYMVMRAFEKADALVDGTSSYNFEQPIFSEAKPSA